MSHPYQAEDELYFERRQSVKMAGKFTGRSLLAYLYQQQSGKCAHCGQPITESTGWDRHHIKPKHLGGKDTDDNLVLLHLNRTTRLRPSYWYTDDNLVCCTPIATTRYTTMACILQNPPRRCAARKETGLASETFEPYEVKVSRTVLRGVRE